MILKEAMSNSLAIIDRVECLELASSGEKVDDFILLDIREIIDAKFIKAILNSMIESTDI